MIYIRSKYIDNWRTLFIPRPSHPISSIPTQCVNKSFSKFQKSGLQSVILKVSNTHRNKMESWGMIFKITICMCISFFFILKVRFPVGKMINCGRSFDKVLIIRRSQILFLMMHYNCLLMKVYWIFHRNEGLKYETKRKHREK